MYSSYFFNVIHIFGQIYIVKCRKINFNPVLYITAGTSKMWAHLRSNKVEISFSPFLHANIIKLITVTSILGMCRMKMVLFRSNSNKINQLLVEAFIFHSDNSPAIFNLNTDFQQFLKILSNYHSSLSIYYMLSSTAFL